MKRTKISALILTFILVFTMSVCVFAEGEAAPAPTAPTDGGAAGGNNLLSFLPMLAIIAFMVIFFIFSSRKSKKEQQQVEDMRNNLQIGDEVTTIGGIIGRVVSVKGETVLIETGRDKVKIRFLRTAIRSVDVKAEDAE